MTTLQPKTRRQKSDKVLIVAQEIIESRARAKASSRLNVAKITLDQVATYPCLFRFYLQSRLEGSEFAELLAHHEEKFMMQIVRLKVERESKTGSQTAKTLAKHLVAVRTGLVFTWLTARETTPAAQRRGLFETLKKMKERL